MDSIEKRMNAFVEACERQGLKVTDQRTEIFREVASRQDHPDAAP
jgi:Fur family peroxide stress response transcriptional regulator